MSLFRNWIFTYNNYPESVFDELTEAVSCGRAQFVLAGKELAPSTQTPHLQGYIQFYNGIRLKQLKEFWPTAHFEEAHGNYYDNEAYCKKDGDYFTCGKPKRSAQRFCDRLTVDSIRNCASVRALMEERNDTMRHSDLKMAVAFLGYVEKKRDWMPEVVWIFGEPGTGKSRLSFHYAKEKHGDDFYVFNGNKWFDGYDGHKCIVINEFRDTQLDFCTFLCLLDRYEYRLEVKGGFRQCLAETIIINSVMAPSHCYRGHYQSHAQIMRRIKWLVHMDYYANMEIDFWFWSAQEIERIWEEKKREIFEETEP